MAKPERVILFVAPDAADARAAADAFSAAAKRLGLAWSVRSAGASAFPLLSDVSVLVVWDELSFDIKDWEGRIERFPAAISRKASVS